MRMRLRSRLTLTMLSVLVLGMGLAAVLSWRAVEQLYLRTQGQNLMAQAQLTAAALQGAVLPVVPVEPYSQTMNVMPGIHTRLLGDQGVVLVGLPLEGDAAPVPPAENLPAIPPDELLQRPEIQAALAGRPSSLVRRVVTAGNARVLYATAPVLAEDNTVEGIVYMAMPLPAGSLPVDVIWQLLGTVLTASILAGAAGVLLSRRISRPLEGLAVAADAVAGGDLKQRTPVEQRVRELHSLGAAFNNMTANLRQSDESKKAFIADVTHELRTPLTVISGTIETLEDGALDDLEGRGPLLQSMAAETQRLIRLVNDLLVLTRADAGALNLRKEPVDLGALARMRCEHLEALANQHRVALVVDVGAAMVVRGDVDRLTQVLDNLLENALRHAPEDSRVTVSLSREGNEVRCVVRDEGSGIAAEHLEMIFERFFRVEPSRKRHSCGSGLGLSIVQSLVLAHGGRIAVESIEGQGMTMIFWLDAT